MFYRDRFRMIFLAQLVLCLGVLSCCGSDNGGTTPQPGVFTWNVQQDPIGGDDLREVSALDATHVWAVGHGGMIMFYDGTSWEPQESNADEILVGVSALDDSNVWSVGHREIILFGTKQRSQKAFHD